MVDTLRLLLGSLITVIGTLVIPSTSFADSPRDAMEVFGLLGTWSNDCATTPAKGGRDVARVTFAAPRFFGEATLTEVFYMNKGVIKLHMKITSAVRVTDEKIKLTVVIIDQTANDEPMNAFDARPVEFPISKIGNKLQTRFFQATTDTVLEKCLN